MSNLGFLSLFHHISSVDGIRAYRVFIERNNKLFSPDITDNHYREILLNRFDAVFYSVSFELDYLNIIKMLKRSNIPPLKMRRSSADPIVIIGGITVTSNPDVLYEIADVVYTGDMEFGLNGIIEILFNKRFKKNDNLLADLKSIKCIYTGNDLTDNNHQKCKAEAIREPAHSIIVTKETVFSNKFLVEIARGCKNSCKFCMTRVANFPPRQVSGDIIIPLCEIAYRYTRNVGFIAPVVTDNPELVDIVKYINKIGMTVSFSSLRADRFNKSIAEIMRINHQRSITFAPETGTDRLRRIIGKVVTNDRILESVKIAVESGIKNFRYYFMYGLPDETEDDINGIVELSKETLSLIGKKGTLHLSINPFIPKRGTQFQNESLYDPEYYKYIKDNIYRLKSEFGKNISIKFESLKIICTHYALSVGNRNVGVVIADRLASKNISEVERYFKEVLSKGNINGA